VSNETDTCRKYVVPKLVAAGWNTEPHSLAEQRVFMAYFDSISAKLNHVRQFQQFTAMELDALLPSILDKAFKGELQ
jgi:type I site-specific restriction endonuclease